jgi:hypothetical protein
MPVYEQLAHDCIESIAELAAIERARSRSIGSNS